MICRSIAIEVVDRESRLHNDGKHVGTTFGLKENVLYDMANKFK